MDINVPLLITISIILLILVICILALSYSNKFPEDKRSAFLKDIKKIEDEMFGSYFSPRDIIVRLDSILSRAMQTKYGNTSTCADNLRKSKKLIYKELYDKIWTYHRLRNNIVHENIDVNESEAKEAFKVYRSVIYKIID